MRTLFSIFCRLWILAPIFLLTSCVEEPEIPTKTKMEGVWVVEEAYDEDGVSILNKVSFPIAAFYLSSDNTILSTGGPLTTYVVYGDSKWTQISSKVDQVFNYANLTFNGGEFFVGDGVVDRFTIEMKLEGIGGTSSLVEILSLCGIQAEWLKEVVYHKFLDVGVSFDDTDEIMYWDFDYATFARYNMKDKYGDYVSWQGWPVENFSRCTFKLRKQTGTIKDVVANEYKK